MDAGNRKKHAQLGMNHGTAQNRLVKDILYKLVVETGKDCCFQCGQKIAREQLSIEHKVPWLDSEDPVKLFFDLDNIAFSHHSCNIKAARRPHKKYFTEEEKRKGHQEKQNQRRRGSDSKHNVKRRALRKDKASIV
jgi:hypothetical protein